MPYTATEELIVRESERPHGNNERFHFIPRRQQSLGAFTVMCFILNRMIGSGIFVTPAKVLSSTGSVGGSLLFWAAGAVISQCGLWVWLECGLSIPQRLIRQDGRDVHRPVPRSGGDKNYLEFMFESPKFRTTCVYSIMFTLLANSSSNAVAFGIYVLEAANQYNPTTDPTGTVSEPNHAHVVALAITALSAAIAIHIGSRGGGIALNNFFAVVKVTLLVAMIVLGIIKACGARMGGKAPQLQNFDPSTSFQTTRHDFASYADSMLFVVYSYSGFKQPFYVLGEVKRPHKVFRPSTLLAFRIAAVLFMLVNIAFLFAIPKDEPMNSPNVDMAAIFFQDLFGSYTAARRAMAALIAFSIFGNIIVVTFTAARVKQEIAREGILFQKLSTIFGESRDTPWAWFKNSRRKWVPSDPQLVYDQSPMAALGLHWLTSITLIVATYPLKPTAAYFFLVSLYSYTIIVLLGCWLSYGLLRTKLRKKHSNEPFDWSSRRSWAPFISPFHVIIYFTAYAFLLVAAFIPPSSDSPYNIKRSGFQWYVVPAIGISSPFWGYLWYLGILAYQRIKHLDLDVRRIAYWTQDPDNSEGYVQRAEKVTFSWEEWSPDRDGHAVRHARNPDEDDNEELTYGNDPNLKEHSQGNIATPETQHNHPPNGWSRDNQTNRFTNGHLDSGDRHDQFRNAATLSAEPVSRYGGMSNSAFSGQRMSQ